MGSYITYALGGYNPAAPNDNKAEELVDNGDGTGTLTDYTTDPPTVTQLTGLPIPEPEPVDPLVTLLAALADAQTLEEVRQAAQEAST